MVNTAKKRILLLITNSFAAINLIHSGLLKKIAGQYEVHILSDLLKASHIDQINQYFDIKITLIDQKISDENNTVRLIRRLEKRVFFSSFNIETQIVKDSSQSLMYQTSTYYITNLLRFFSLDKLLLVCLRKLIILLTTFPKTSNKLDQLQFCGIISTSPLDIRENSIVNYFNARNVTSLAMIISWDNLTSKGIINANHDYMLVWNAFMAEEYRRFYSIFTSEAKVRITGIPRFDTYYQHSENDNFKIKHGIAGSDKIILFATSATKHFPDQLEIVKDLVQYSRSTPNVFLIVRCHPADNYNPYQSLSNNRKLMIWHADHGDALHSQIFSEWLPDPGFLGTLSDMLHHCDVCVQVASTMRLDAAACNKPIISIAYDGPRTLPYHKSVRRFYDYSHQIPLNKLQIDIRVHSKKQLFYELDSVLKSDFTPDYRRSIQPFIHHTEAQSVDAVMQNIQEWLA